MHSRSRCYKRDGPFSKWPPQKTNWEIAHYCSTDNQSKASNTSLSELPYNKCLFLETITVLASTSPNSSKKCREARAIPSVDGGHELVEEVVVALTGDSVYAKTGVQLVGKQRLQQANTAWTAGHGIHPVGRPHQYSKLCVHCRSLYYSGSCDTCTQHHDHHISHRISH